MRMSLRNKFLIPTILLLIIALGVSGAISYFQSRSALVTEVNKEITQLTESTTKVIDWWIRDKTQDLATWSKEKIYQDALKDSFVAKSARKAATAQFVKLKDTYGYYETVNLADANGDIVAASDEKIIGKIKIAERSYFKASMAGKMFISEPLKSKNTGNPVFVVSAPVESQGKTAGVMFMVIDLAAFNTQFVDPIKMGKTGYAYIYDGSGLVLAHPNKDNILKLNMKEFDFGREMMAQKEGLKNYVYQGVEKMVSFKRAQAVNWTFAVGAGTAELMAPVHRMGYMNLTVGVVTVVLGLVVIFWWPGP